jgi:uncharacterized protein YukE
MDAMDKAFKEAAKTMEATISEMGNIAKAMEGGALVGDAGAEFVSAINGKLVKKLNTLMAKMNELNGDIDKAQAANRQAEGTAGKRFKN